MNTKKPMEPQIIAAWIGAGAVILAAIIAGTFALWHFSPPPSTPTVMSGGNTEQPTPTPTPPTGITNPTTPLTIPCIQGPCNLAGTVTLTSIDLDKANQKMTWHFHITVMADGTYGFSQLYLEDSSTMTYQAGGQVSDKWTLKSGDSTDESPTFGFIPQCATPYKLYLVLLVISSGGVGNSGVNYETETFTFNTCPTNQPPTGTTNPTTPSSQILPQTPLTIPCIQGPCNLAGTVTLTSIDLDKANQKMTWHFHITVMADGTYGFSQLYLEDSSTMTYQAGGQVSDKWTLKSGDSTDESPTFGFIPHRATPYKLYLVLLVISSGGVGNSGVNYETETFTFNT